MQRVLTTSAAWFVALAIVVCAATEIGCKSAEKRYLLRGQVVKEDLPSGEITVKNDEIPGFMSAMTMRYKIHGSGTPPDLQPGDMISAQVYASQDGRDYFLENISITDSSGRKH